MGGLTNVMAPTLFIYSIELNQSRKDIVQSTNLCFLFGKITQLVLFTVSVKFSGESWVNSIYILAIVGLFLPLGLWLKTFINERVYKKVLKILLGLIAVSLAIQATLN